jgi:hypothetical protein
MDFEYSIKFEKYEKKKVNKFINSISKNIIRYTSIRENFISFIVRERLDLCSDTFKEVWFREVEDGTY